MPTILITGFGPFPGAPYNPTIALVERLMTLRRPALSDVTLVSHVFETSYAAVDRDLPALLAQHKPDALLMFGLAAATPHIRIETRAQNALTLLPDASGAVLRRDAIADGEATARTLPAPHRKLLAAARTAGVQAKLSRDAGRYLCNYLCWHATQAGGPKLAAFVHVPLVRQSTAASSHAAHSRESGNPVLSPLGPRFRGDERRFTENKLARVGTRVLLALAAEIRR